MPVTTGNPVDATPIRPFAIPKVPDGELKALRARIADGCRYCPPSPNASPTAVIPPVSAKAKLKITSSAPASM
jgi:hypothetical protein